jgi:hypothetical protein
MLFIRFRESAPRRRSRNVDQMMARWALDLPSSKLDTALEMLFAMRAFKFEVSGVH